MRINLAVQYQWSERQDRYIVVRRKSINWTNSVDLCKGASAQQSQLADSQQSFYNTLSNDYNTQFSQQNAILGTLQNSLNPIIQAGPNQFGYNTSEVNTLNSQAIQGTGQQYANASQALKANQAAEGGGNIPLPSGVQSQQQAGLASSAANQASNQLLGIQNAGYEQGHQQYESAIGQLGGVAGMYNPNGVAGAANQGGGVANSEANTVTQLNNAASPWNLVGGILGGAASAGLDALTGGLGGGLAGSLLGGSSAGPYTQGQQSGSPTMETTGDETPYQI